MAPETRYARKGDISIAYQVVGDGPPNIVLSSGIVSHMALMWSEPQANAMLRRMWPVYSRALRQTFVSAISNEEAALIAAALSHVNEPPREDAGAARKSAKPPHPHRG